MLSAERFAIRIKSIENEDMACRIKRGSKVECFCQMGGEKPGAAGTAQGAHNRQGTQSISIGLDDRTAHRWRNPVRHRRIILAQSVQVDRQSTAGAWTCPPSHLRSSLEEHIVQIDELMIKPCANLAFLVI
jgi:hypothetical protein